VEVLNRNAQKHPNGTPDFELVAALKAMDLTPPNQQQLFHTNYARLESITVDELFNYYNDTIALYEQIRRQVSASEKEKELLEAFAKQARMQEVSYAVTMEPGHGLTQGKLVQIVDKVCKGGKNDCQNVSDLEGFLVTYSPGGKPFEAKLAGNG